MRSVSTFPPEFVSDSSFWFCFTQREGEDTRSSLTSGEKRRRVGLHIRLLSQTSPVISVDTLPVVYAGKGK